MKLTHHDPRFLAAAWILIVLFVSSIASAIAAAIGAGDQGPLGKSAILHGDIEIQRRPNTCGVSALSMALASLGIQSDPIALEQEMSPSIHGVSMLVMKECAQRRGVKAEGWRLTPADLKRMATPAILFIGGNHFVVFDSLGSEGSAFLRDPAIGRRVMDLHELEELWEGETLVLTKLPDNTDSLKHRTM